MQDYRKLDVWTKSHELALDVHRVLSAEAGGAGVDADLRRTLHRAAVYSRPAFAHRCGPRVRIGRWLIC